MMASDTEVANRALSKLGEARLVALTDDTKGGRAMLARFAMLRDAELMAANWRFAVRRVNLAASLVVPAWGFSTIYPRPVDDLRPLRIDGIFIDARSIGLQFEDSGFSPSQPGFSIIEGSIQTNRKGPLKYEYLAQITTVALWDPLFVEAFACRLAMDAAEELTQSQSKMEAVAMQYKAAIAMARRTNAIMELPRIKPVGAFVLARFGNG